MTSKVARTIGGRRLVAVLAPVFTLLTVGALILGASRASAAQAPVGLGTADSFAVLGGRTVTNTGPTVVSGDLGVSPGSAVTGFPPGAVVNGTIHAADAAAEQAQSDVTTAYNDAADRTPATRVSRDLVGQTLTPGVYKAPSSLRLTGTVRLDAEGDPQAVFIFQIRSTLVTRSNSNVALIRGAQACNVFWQVGSSATLGTNTTFRGNILALTSITLNTGASIDGRALARNGAVTMDSNVVTRPVCSTATSTATTSASPTSTTSATPSTSASATATATAVPGPTATTSVSVTVSSSVTASATMKASSSASVTATTGGTESNGAPGRQPAPSGSASSSSTRAGGSLADTGASLLGPVAGGVGVLLVGSGLRAVSGRSRRH
jgi:hypothetical protein